MHKLLLTLLIVFAPAIAFGADVTKTIGTNSRDYSTITLWEADLDDTGIYSSGDNAIGEMYNDSAFDEDFEINGGGTVGLNSITLRAAAGEEGDGTAGSGVRIVLTTDKWGVSLIDLNTSVDVTIEDLEVDLAGFSGFNVIEIRGGGAETIDSVMVHGAGGTVTKGVGGGNSAANAEVRNSLVYDMTVNDGVAGIRMDNNWSAVQYNTVYDVTSSGSAGECYQVRKDLSSSDYLQNNIGMGCDTDFVYDGGGSDIMTRDHNMSSDTTADGTGSLTSQTASDQFVSITGGSEDFHLKSGSDAEAAGTPISTPTSITTDHDGDTRDGTTPDMGYDEFVGAAAPAAVPDRDRKIYIF